jgi:biopolymer transport protein ExbB/TolQ
MASLPHADILQLVERAADRRRRTVLLELRRGVNSLATIVVIAPWLGILATLFGILGCFLGSTGDKFSYMIEVMYMLGQAAVPTALGLAVAVPTGWLHRHLRNQLESMDHEMRLGISELSRQLRASQRS